MAKKLRVRIRKSKPTKPKSKMQRIIDRRNRKNGKKSTRGLA